MKFYSAIRVGDWITMITTSYLDIVSKKSEKCKGFPDWMLLASCLYGGEFFK